jgi:Holliday junction resolvase
MATTPEGKVKKKVKEVLDDLGAYYFMPATGGFGRSGVPDFIGCHNGTFFGIECKAGRGIPTALQEREIRRIINAGGYAWVINEENVDRLGKMLEGV